MIANVNVVLNEGPHAADGMYDDFDLFDEVSGQVLNRYKAILVAPEA